MLSWKGLPVTNTTGYWTPSYNTAPGILELVQLSLGVMSQVQIGSAMPGMCTI
jgi:hypothetical protein